MKRERIGSDPVRVIEVYTTAAEKRKGPMGRTNQVQVRYVGDRLRKSKPREQLWAERRAQKEGGPS